MTQKGNSKVVSVHSVPSQIYKLMHLPVHLTPHYSQESNGVS